MIIVDDEKLVRDNIRQCINWEAHGFCFRGAYANGKEAIDAIKREQPQVVLTDICMPFMDGLQLCAYLHQNHPSIKVILLTGFDDFEYAQQALRMKAYDYMLKPITACELRSLLDKVKLDMKEEQSQHCQLMTMRMQLNQSLPLLMEKKLEEMISIQMPVKERNKRLREFHLPELNGNVIAMMIDLDDFGSRKSNLTIYDQGLLRYACLNITSELSSRRGGIAFQSKEEKIIVLLANARAELLDAAAEALAEEIKGIVGKQLKLTITVGIGEICTDAADLPHATRTANQSLSYRLFLGINRTITYREVVKRRDSDLIGTDWGRRLSLCLKTESVAEARLLLDEIFGNLKLSTMTIEGCYRLLLRLITAVMDTLREVRGELAFLEEGIDPFQELYQWKTLEQIRLWLEKLCNGAIAIAADQRSQIVNGGMIIATDYIEKHFYKEDLSLHAVCKHVMMSPSYFSASFKQFTGKTFVEYLTRIRMQKAKEYLLCSDLRSYEIAYKIGYKDHNYFSAVFKKQTGQSPTEYREHRLRSFKHEA